MILFMQATSPQSEVNFREPSQMQKEIASFKLNKDSYGCCCAVASPLQLSTLIFTWGLLWLGVSCFEDICLQGNL